MIQTIKVFDDRKVSPSRLIVGNQFENGIERIQFELPENMLEKGYRYLILNKPSEDESYPIPLDENNIFYVDSRLTYYLKGVWIANVVLVKDEIKEDSLNPDTLTFISDNITLIVKSNYINNEYLGELPLPENLKIIYDDLLKMYETIKSDYENGNFNGQDGKSAYELAVENGFEGTEEEWLESLRYDHSDEFEKLAEQVKQDAQSSADNATKAENAMNEANTTARENVEAINQASTNAQNAITTTKDNAVKAVSDKQTEAVQAVDTAQISATQAIAEQKESAVSAITQERSEAIEAIETDRTGALNDIETAKDNAIEEIENTGVPLEDIEKLAIKETAEGNPTIISADSADWRLQKLNVYSNGVNNGVTRNCEGSVVIFSGTILEDSAFRINAVLHNKDTYKAGKTYYAKSFTDDVSMDIVVNKQDNSTVYLTEYTVDGTEKEIYYRCIINNTFNKPGVSINKVAYVAITENAAMSEWEPYTGGKPSPSPDYPQEIISKEVSEIKVTGKNLFDFVTLAGGEGATFEKNGLSARIENGYLITTGTAINDTFTNIIFISVPPEKRTIFSAGTYRLGKGDKGITNLTIGVTTVSGKDPVNYGSAFTIDEPFYFNYFYIAYALGQNANSEKCPLIMAYGSEPLYEYEPYIEPQVVNLTSPITLRGIPVDNGGNVTIDRQQYVADVITEKDGVIGVERNNDEIVIDGTINKARNVSKPEWTELVECSLWDIIISKNHYPGGLSLSGLCNMLINKYNNEDYEHFYITDRVENTIAFFILDSRLSTIDVTGANEWLKQNNPKLLYRLAEPTFEPLPEDIQAQYKALKSYYPNTVIQSGAFNEVTFIADTKMYIDKKIAELNPTLLNIQANMLKGV